MISPLPEQVSLFNGYFEPALLAEIQAKSMVMNVKAGETMLNPGQTIRAVPLLLNGVFKVSRVNEEGQEILLYYVKERESCAMTFTCCMMANPSVVRGTAEEDSELICVPVELMDEWYVRYPSWKRFVMTTVLNRFMEIIKCMDDVAFNNTDTRLMNYLKQKAEVTGSSLINLTHQEIADDLGTNRVTVSRLLKKQELEKKLLLFRNQIRLLKDM
jgi:CRP/FNR family transcriptional regulator